MNLKKLKIWIVISIVIIILILVALTILAKTPKIEEPDSIFKQDSGQTEIRYTNYNEIKYAYISDQQICNIYLTDYKSNMINHPETAYEMLDKSYREARFGTLEKYKEYLNNHQEEILQLKLNKFQILNYKDGNQYICQDQYENYYIFKETAIMKYTVMLDTYTIALPEYIDNYNKSSSTERSALCINRFIEALKDENYTFAYNVLSTGFKNNYFKTQDSFENYAKTVFNGYSEVEYGTASTEGELITCPVTLKNTTKSTQKTFIVKLGESTNFELSFNVN